MDMQTGKTLTTDVVSAWHGELMPLRTTLEMLIESESHSNEGSQIRSVIALVHERLNKVLDEMDQASLNMRAAAAGDQDKPSPDAPPPPGAMPFSIGYDDLYQVHPKASRDDVMEHLSARLCQLNAMLIQTVGNGAETFNNWSDEIRDNYLWACQAHAHECEDLVQHLATKSLEKARE